MKYATERTFDGQRASLGRTVIVRFKRQDLEAGVVTSIMGNDDVALRGLESERRSCVVTFIQTKTEDDIRRLPEGSWTWPVRV